MFIPVVHYLNVTIKNILYSDTVLKLDDLGSNIKMTTISEVGEYSLENCINTILENNPNVTFNTIQYSKNDQKVYFYANEKVETKSWDESHNFIYEPLRSKKEILSEVKRILETPISYNEDWVSIYDVVGLIKNKYAKFECSKEYYENELEYLLKSNLGNIHCILYDFDYETNHLTIGIKDFSSYNYEDITFTKKDGDLIIVSSSYYDVDEIFSVAGNLLSKIYDRMLEYKNFEEQNNFGFAAVNSNFFVDISNSGVSISNDDFFGEFELSLWSFDNDYEYKCNSIDVINTIRGKEEEIFKRIFVKIDNCPEWTKSQLSIKRKDEVTRYRISQQKQQEKEMKRVRRRELANKIFPFIKDYKNWLFDN